MERKSAIEARDEIEVVSAQLRRFADNQVTEINSLVDENLQKIRHMKEQAQPNQDKIQSLRELNIFALHFAKQYREYKPRKGHGYQCPRCQAIVPGGPFAFGLSRKSDGQGVLDCNSCGYKQVVNLYQE